MEKAIRFVRSGIRGLESRFWRVMALAAVLLVLMYVGSPCASADAPCTSGADIAIAGTYSYQDGSAYKTTFTSSGMTADKSVDFVNGMLPLANGGTAKALTAVNGGIIYSDADSMEVLGAGSSGQVLRSGGAGAPSWSTATFPATAGSSGQWLRSDGTNFVLSTATLPVTASGTGTILRADGTNWAASTATYPGTVTANRLLYAWATNVSSDLASGNNGVLVTDGSGVPSISSTIPSATQDNITRLGTIASGAIPATYLTAGTFGAGTYSFSGSTLTTLGTVTSLGTVNGGTINAGLTWSAAQNLNSQALTNVNVDSGTVDGISSLTTTGDAGIGGATTFTPGASRRLLQVTNGTNGGQIALYNSTESSNPRIFYDSGAMGIAGTGSTGVNLYSNNSLTAAVTGGTLDIQNNNLNNVGNASTDITSTSLATGVKLDFKQSQTINNRLPQIVFSGTNTAGSITSIVYTFTNLSTSDVDWDGATGTSDYGWRMAIVQLSSVEGDTVTFLLFGAFDAGVEHRVVATGCNGGTTCTLTQTSKTAWNVTGIGDGRQYNFSCTAGAGTCKIALNSGTATGTTSLSVIYFD